MICQGGLSMKYKVGDRVRIKRDLKQGDDYEFGVIDEMEGLKGHVVTIARIDGNIYKLKEDKGDWNWSEEMFEKLAEFNKSDLKDGDVVTYRSGEKRIVTDNAEKLRGFNCIGHHYTSSFEEDLKEAYGDTDLDIIRVERPTQYIDVFKREEKRKMAIKEIEKELGYSIEIIKEREE